MVFLQKKRIEEFLKKLDNLEAELDSDNFLCNISYSSYLVKNKNESDIILSNGDNGPFTKIIKKITIAKEPKDIYKYRFNSILSEINKPPSQITLTRNKLINIIKEHKIKGNDLYHYNIENVNIYSIHFINYLKQILQG